MRIVAWTHFFVWSGYEDPYVANAAFGDNPYAGVFDHTELGEQSIDLAILPTIELPDDIILFPDEEVELSGAGASLLQLIRGGSSVELGGRSVPLVKIRAHSQVMRDDDRGVCTVAGVWESPSPKSKPPSDVHLHIRVLARVFDGADPDISPGDVAAVWVTPGVLYRTPDHLPFGDRDLFDKTTDNFRKLIEQSALEPVSAVSNLDYLKTLENISDAHSGRFSIVDDALDPTEANGHRHDVWGFNDAAADYLAACLIRHCPDVDVPASEQQKWLSSMYCDDRLGHVNDFIVGVLTAWSTPQQKQLAGLVAQKKKWEKELDDRKNKRRGSDWGNEFLKKKIDDMALGEELADIRARIMNCGMPRVVWMQLQRMLEAPKPNEKSYLRYLVELPWQARQVETIDIARAKESLDERHVGLDEAKDRILGYLAVRGRTPDAKPPGLCLVGPPGVGKTSLAKSIADAVGRRIAMIPCAAISVSDLRGTHYGYTDARPGRIIDALRRVGSRNPVLVLDEIDKTLYHDVDAALLDALDPMQNAEYLDRYVDVPFDISEVFFIATANVGAKIAGPLVDRLEIIELRGYSPEDKFKIAKQILVNKVMDKNGLTGDAIEFSDDAVWAIVRDHAPAMGIRRVEEAIAKICRKAALTLETGGDGAPTKVHVDEKTVSEEFGRPGSDKRTVMGIEELRAGIELGALPTEARDQGRRELDLLSSDSPGGGEYFKRLLYLQWLVGLPWSECDEEILDMGRARRVLDERHWGMETVKGRILEYLAARKLDAPAKGSSLCFVGPPGVGKTSLAKSIAEALGRKLAVVSCSGLGDETELLGHNRTWLGSGPGRITRTLRSVGTKNPVLVLDEVDKMGHAWGKGGAPADVLLEVLDPTQNSRFVDHYIEVPLDLSEVFFIATANVGAKIPGPLVDRLEMIELGGYSDREKLDIARGHLVGRQIANYGLTGGHSRITDAAIRAVIGGYTREAGVRELERRLGDICRRVALWRAEGRESAVEVTERTVVEILGAPKWSDEEVEGRMKRRGVALGLAWTERGGEVLLVQVRRMRGSGTLTFTGQLGDVMRESGQAALSWVRANGSDYGIDPAFYEGAEIHVHVPAGAVPKDGPSAGITLVAALVGEVAGRRVRSDVAMTGEIDLSGGVLRVGGIKEKVLAGRRAGISTFILPQGNERFIREEVGEDLLREIDVHYVSTIEEALDVALLPRE